jgi:hypothetical protein
MATHERFSALYDALKQKADEQGLNPNEITKIRNRFFTKVNDEWTGHPAFWKPTGLVFGYPFPKSLEEKFISLRADILDKLALKPDQYWLPSKDQLHSTIASYSHYSETGLNVVALPDSEMPTVKRIVSNSDPIHISYEGALLTSEGALLAKGFVDNEDLFLLRENLRKEVKGITQQALNLAPVKLAHIITGDVPYEKVESVNRQFSCVDLGDHLFTGVTSPRGEFLRFRIR